MKAFTIRLRHYFESEIAYLNKYRHEIYFKRIKFEFIDQFFNFFIRIFIHFLDDL